MSSEAGPSQQIQQVGKKRKRTGKEREERKQAAILAAQTKTEEAELAVSESHVNEGALTVEPQPPAVDFATLEKRLPRALTHLRHVFKRAKTMEMTRLIKKIKQLRSKGGSETELADLEAQRQLMAHVNLTTILSSHLLVNLRKHRLLKRAPDSIPSTVVDQLKPSASSTSSSEITKKVENRLCSSKAVAQEMKSAIAWLMSEEGAKLGSGVKADTSTPKTTSMRVSHAVARGKASKAAEEEALDDEEDDEEGVNTAPRRDVVVNSDEEEEDEEEDAAGWESGSVSGDDQPSTSKRSIALAGPDSEEGDADDDDDAVLLSPEPIAKKSKLKPETSARPSKQLTSSTFLPSLSAGFTRGGSEDSDPDDDFGEGLEDIIGKSGGVRKNRRGQRARQMIWERKYGKNAKHVQKAKAKELEGNIANAYGKRAGPAKSTPSSGSARPTTSTVNNPTQAAAASTTTTFDRRKIEPAAPAVNKSSASLHPSWEAARLRKQKEAAGPKATKIVFD